MTVRIAAFARIREILGAASLVRSLPGGSTARDALDALAVDFPALAALRTSTRLVRGGRIVAPETPLAEGDELGLLPPFGGG